MDLGTVFQKFETLHKPARLSDPRLEPSTLDPWTQRNRSAISGPHEERDEMTAATAWALILLICGSAAISFAVLYVIGKVLYRLILWLS